MRNLVIKCLATVVVVAFAALGIHSIVNTNHTLELKKVQLQSTDAKLKALQLNYNQLNVKLNNALTDGKTTQQQLQQLQQERDQLEQQKQQLEQQVSLKQQQDAAAKTIAKAASLSGTAYAATDANSDKMYIYSHESGNNPGSVNTGSGACGLGQALPCSKMPCSLSDYACQDNYFTGYMLARYGTWANAAAFWSANHWW